MVSDEMPAGVAPRPTLLPSYPPIFLPSRRRFLAGLAGLAALRCAPTVQWGRDVGPPLAQPGGVLRVVVSGELPHFDPQSQIPAVQLVGGLVYSRLIRPRSGAGIAYDSGELVEDLAERWEQADELTHIFYLRRGVRWHDIAPVSGRELNSDDVKLSIERLIAMKTSAHGPALAAVERIELPDRYTVKITLKEPHVELPSVLSSPAARIVPVELVERATDLQRLVIGTGPFFVDRPERGGRLIVRKNPAHFRPGLPYLDGIEVLFASDRASELAILRAGQADLGPEPFGLLPGDGDGVRGANGDVQVHRFPRPTTFLLAFNVTRPPFNDVRSRQAVSQILDRRRLGGDAYGDYLNLSGHLPPSLVEWALAPEEVERIWGRRDPARAKFLWADSVPVDPGELTLLVHPQADAPGLVDHLVDQVRELGIRLRPIRLEGVALTRALSDRVYDLVLLQPAPSTEPDDWTAALYGSTAPRNLFGYVDRRFDELAIRTRRQVDPQIRRRAFLDVQRYLADKLPATPLFSPMHAYAMSTSLKGWSPHWSAGLPSIEEGWLYRPRQETSTTTPAGTRP